MISQDELFEWLEYKPNDGVFVWRKSPSTRIKAGTVAGSQKKIGYISVTIKRQTFYAHRLAWYYMTGEVPNCEIDHINMRKDDNRWSNLRLATKKQNSENRMHVSHNTSGHMGVYWVGRYNKWAAKIVHNGKQIHIGYYFDKDDAIRARVETERKIFSHAPERSVL